MTIAKDGSVIASGITSSANLPVTAGAFQSRGRGGDTQGSPVLDSFVVRFNEPPPAPQVSIASVVNEASGNGGTVSPGLRIVITGQNLTLPGQTTQVLFDAVPAVVESATDKQIIATVPYDVDGSSKTKMLVDTGTIKSAPLTIPVAAVMPRGVRGVGRQ